MLAGPDADWMKDHHAGEKEARGELRQLTEELQARKSAMRAVDADPQLRPAAEATGILGRYLRIRLRADKEAGRPCDMEGAAIQAVDYGTP